MTAIRGYQWGMAGRDGLIVGARQFMNSLDESSFAEIQFAIREEQFLADYYDLGDRFIRSKDGRISYDFVGLSRNLDSIKSKARILLFWNDEAESTTEEAWQKVLPTIREEGAEAWLTWNPESRNSATNKRFLKSTDPMHKIVEINWQDNPWFPDRLNRQRLTDFRDRPDQYPHIWNGEFKTVFEGAYYTHQLSQARLEKRIGRVAVDPLMTIRLMTDIGGTGQKADNFVFGACQFVGKEIRWLNHYEKQGQPIDAHLAWLRSQKYTPDRAHIWLPHDGKKKDSVYDVSYKSAFEDAGYTVEVVPNQGAGAAMQRVEASRRRFPQMWFNEDTTTGLIEALAGYHAKTSGDGREIDLGPDHDEFSHSSDMFGMASIVYEEPEIVRKADYEPRRQRSSSSWMTA